ncbi:MAG: hypothetical protein EOO47_22725 [Flavobacterium sp.]|nr:MAG: hypothetical protein EOO47_22725 [Flavobacterium sp.]
MREAQYEALGVMGKSGIVITADVGSDQTIHPPDKTTVAERFAKVVLAKTYGLKIPYQGPEFNSVKFDADKAVISFKYINGGLVFKGTNNDNFEIAGSDHIFYLAKAKIVGDKIEVTADKVSHAMAVRYAFKNYFVGKLYNGDGLPAVPFRTDRWDEKKQ